MKKRGEREPSSSVLRPAPSRPLSRKRTGNRKPPGRMRTRALAAAFIALAVAAAAPLAAAADGEFGRETKKSGGEKGGLRERTLARVAPAAARRPPI